MNKSELAREVVFLATKFYSPGNNKSAFKLLQETDYFASHELVTIEDISAALSLYPQCIKSWISMAADNRSDGWYWAESRDNPSTYVVGSHRGTDKKIEFTDMKIACATYIKYWAEETRALR